MNLELRNLFDQILKAPARTKLVVLLSCLAVVAALGISGWVAGQLKQAEIMFKFSLEVRNKLIDAYRETMRMSV